jgi:hypothetical protein
VELKNPVREDVTGFPKDGPNARPFYLLSVSTVMAETPTPSQNLFSPHPLK